MSYLLAARDRAELDVVEADPVVDPFTCFLGASPAVAEALELARHLATRSGPNVLLIGEPGTGKELLARAIHRASPRAHAPFVAVDCSAIPAGWIETELFGAERGARPGLFELAGDGTLFLEDVGRIPLDLQPKLLRALEERRVRRAGGFEEVEVRCRLIAATTQPLETLVRDGGLREDLFHRLSLVRVALPPLREREDDVLLLAQRFLVAMEETHGMPAAELSVTAVDALCAHPWRGNARELREVMEHAALAADGRTIEADMLGLVRSGAPTDGRFAGPRAIRVPAEGRSLESTEAELVRLTLELTGGNKSAAARILGISRPTLDRKIAAYDVALDALAPQSGS